MARGVRWYFAGWITLSLCLLIVLPILTPIFSLFSADWSTFEHLYKYLLPGYISETFIVASGVLSLSILFGVSSAWFVVMYRFPLHRFLSVGLVLPLSIPAYILGFAYVGYFEHGGFLYTLGIRPDIIMNRYGAIILLSLALYPYVYLLSKSAFLGQSRVLFEASFSLAKNSKETFWLIALPLARPAIVGASMLVLMEALSDYGLVGYFGVGTLSVGIFRVWFGMGDVMSASVLSIALMGIILGAMSIEYIVRRGKRYDVPSTQSLPLRPIRLVGVRALGVMIWCLMIVCMGFILPVAWLIFWAFETFARLNSEFASALLQSFSISILIACVVSLGALWLHFYARSFGKRIGRISLWIGILGYAIPGAVVAVGIMIPFGAADRFVNDLLESLSFSRVGLIFSGTIFALVIGYFIRFLAPAINALESGYMLIPKELDEAVFSLKKGRIILFSKIHFPLLRRALLVSLLVVFVDTLKELPITMILRPFYIDTLAIKAFEYASNERLYEAAWPSLCIVIVGLMPVFWLNKSIEYERY